MHRNWTANQKQIRKEKFRRPPKKMREVMMAVIRIGHHRKKLKNRKNLLSFAKLNGKTKNKLQISNKKKCSSESRQYLYHGRCGWCNS
jgi:hypothetical protein